MRMNRSQHIFNLSLRFMRSIRFYCGLACLLCLADKAIGQTAPIQLSRPEVERIVLLSVTLAGELYSIYHPAAPLRYSGISHFYQRRWISAASHFASQTLLARYRDRLDNRIGVRDLSLFPNQQSPGVHFAPRARGYSPSQFSDIARSEVIEDVLFYTRLIDVYSGYAALHDRTPDKNKVKPKSRFHRSILGHLPTPGC
jgi:hypothetical protein